jgi:hypothetical protein
MWENKINARSSYIKENYHINDIFFSKFWKNNSNPQTNTYGTKKNDDSTW